MKLILSGFSWDQKQIPQMWSKSVIRSIYKKMRQGVMQATIPTEA